jgi:hypothetical protein
LGSFINQIQIMEAKIILINVAKVLLFTLVTLLIINLIGFIYDLYLVYKNGQSIQSFEYRKFSFFVNGNQTYNQFSKKHLVLNVIIFIGYFIYLFKDYKSGK